MSVIHHIQNENMKIYSKPSSWALIGIAFLSVLFVLLLSAVSDDQSTLGFWETVCYLFQTENQIFYLIIIITVSQIVSNEFSSGTAKLLFIRPLSRLQVMATKLLVAILFSILLLIINLISCIVMATISSGFEVISTADFYQLLILIKLKFFTLIFYSILFFSVALFTKTLILSIIMCLVIMSGLQSLPSMMIIPQTSFYISAIGWTIFCFIILIGSLIHFKRSDI
ncbi:ABC transporter permease [Bacillus sp. C1]